MLRQVDSATSMSSCSVLVQDKATVSVLGSVLCLVNISCTSGQAMLVKGFPLRVVLSVVSLMGERGPGLIEDGLPPDEPP